MTQDETWLERRRRQQAEAAKQNTQDEGGVGINTEGHPTLIMGGGVTMDLVDGSLGIGGAVSVDIEASEIPDFSGGSTD